MANQYYDEASDSYKSDYLYFVRDEVAGAMKIGRTANPYKRYKSICSGNPNKLDLVDAIPNLGWQEAFWHCAFGYARMRREWFYTDDLLLAAMKAARKGGDWTDHVPPPVPWEGEPEPDEGEWQEHMLDALSHYTDLIWGTTMQPKKAAELAIHDPGFNGHCIFTQFARAIGATAGYPSETGAPR